MVSIRKTITVRCPNCQKDTEFDFVLRYIDYNGIVKCFRCTECNEVCPEYSFNQFIQTGKIVIGV